MKNIIGVAAMVAIIGISALANATETNLQPGLLIVKTVNGLPANLGVKAGDSLTLACTHPANAKQYAKIAQLQDGKTVWHYTKVIPGADPLYTEKEAYFKGFIPPADLADNHDAGNGVVVTRPVYGTNADGKNTNWTQGNVVAEVCLPVKTVKQLTLVTTPADNSNQDNAVNTLHFKRQNGENYAISLPYKDTSSLKL